MRISALCPVNRQVDIYDLEIEAKSVIPVEQIIDVIQVAALEPQFQEEITERLACLLPVATLVRTTGVHSGVKTVCQAP